jgi:hypothetical protein
LCAHHSPPDGVGFCRLLGKATSLHHLIRRSGTCTASLLAGHPLRPSPPAVNAWGHARRAGTPPATAHLLPAERTVTLSRCFTGRGDHASPDRPCGREQASAEALPRTTSVRPVCSREDIRFPMAGCARPCRTPIALRAAWLRLETYRPHGLSYGAHGAHAAATLRLGGRCTGRTPEESHQLLYSCYGISKFFIYSILDGCG